MMLSHQIAEQFKLEIEFKPDDAEWRRRLWVHLRLWFLTWPVPVLLRCRSNRKDEIAEYEQRAGCAFAAMDKLMDAPLEDGVEWYTGAGQLE